jgi:hypothetical protein
VRSFSEHDAPQAIPNRCAEHGDPVVSTTKEHRMPRAS